MDSSTASGSRDLSDTDVLQILLKLSDARASEWEAQFPFLDPATVGQVSNSISKILFKGKLDLKKQFVALVRKWCTGKNKSSALCHTAWVGRSITVEQCVDSVLSSCIPIIEDESDWNMRDTEQQLALSYAVLGAATNLSSPLHVLAGEKCALLVNRILKEKSLQPCHHKFLAQIWSSVGELPINDSTLVQMAERSILGIERTMLWLGEKAVNSKQQTISESFDTVIGSKLLACCQSPVVFQNVCNLLTHMMLVSEAHPGVQALIKVFISGVERQCKSELIDICSLYEESCQVVSALLCVDPSLLPEHGEKLLSRDTVLKLLYALPREKAAGLLSHRPTWLLFTF
ncbi:hypothetical protein ONE63_010138 [Megalurothrips usitatus]|uniref:Uncharacterized protein n=1 Tax=Megalurothrips usitatus TaxID=439358 RepID=A0AAV7XNF3_9NEOP|nr:hypothetical protein ONE63_010138 [Megalurothrips usitatus]